MNPMLLRLPTHARINLRRPLQKFVSGRATSSIGAAGPTPSTAISAILHFDESCHHFLAFVPSGMDAVQPVLAQTYCVLRAFLQSSDSGESAALLKILDSEAICSKMILILQDTLGASDVSQNLYEVAAVVATGTMTYMQGALVLK